MGRLLDAWYEVPIQRRKRWVLTLAGAALLVAVIWAARAVLLPYILGLALAYFLSPTIKWIERELQALGSHKGLRFLHPAARPLAILFAYILLIALLVGFFSMVVPLVVEQAVALWEEREVIWDYVSGVADDALEQYRLLPPSLQKQMEESLGRFNEFIANAFEQAMKGTAVAISYTVSLVLAFLIIPLWTFFLLKDARELEQSLLKSVPGPLREDVMKVVALVDGVFGSYLRGQLFLALIIGVVSTIGYSLLGVRFSLVLGVMAAVFELIPNIGPVLGGIPAVLVALIQDPVLALWTALFAFGIQQVENMFLTPRVVGHSVKLHPVVVMVVLIMGSEIGGLAGLFLAPVVTAVLRDLFRYVYYRLEDCPLSPAEALRKVWEVDEFDIGG